MRLITGKSAAASAVATLLALPSTQTYAQDAAAQLEEIVVTARKRSENIQETPISITAFTAETLAKVGAAGINDIATRTPSLYYGNFGDIKLSPMSLRGVYGGSGSAGSDPAVGMYVDEVFVGQGAGASLDLYDIERVEVLRGPQGTLFGRNAIGGVVSITTKRPTQTLAASVQAEYGNYDHTRVGASLSGPLVADRVAGKITAVRDSRGGTSKNVLLDRKVNSEESWSARGQLLFTPGESTEILLTGEYREVDQEPLVFETLSYDSSRLFTQVLDSLGLPRNAAPFDRNVYSDSVNEETLEMRGVAATVKTTLGAVDLVSITSYREHEYFNRSDTDRSALRFLYDGDPEDVERISQELRVSWETGPLEWMLGAYYYQQDTSNLSFVDIGADLADLLGAPALANIRTGSDAKLDAESVAGFANITWLISDSVDFTLGGRYTREEKSIDYVQTDPAALLGGDVDLEASDTWQEFTPSFNLRYRPLPQMLTYLAIAKGFKSGGFNDALGDADGISFDTELVWNYEIGMKTQLGRRLTANLAVYRMNWTDIQLTTDNPNTPIYDPIILNGGKAHSTGIEAEFQAVASDRLLLGLAVSAQDAKYDEGSLASTGEPLGKIPFAPLYTANMNGEYRVPLSNSGALVLLGEYLYRGETFLTLDNDQDGRVGAHGVVNLHASYESDSGRWSVSVWGKNLGDKSVKQRLFDLSDQEVIGQKFIALSDPRTYGVSFRVNL